MTEQELRELAGGIIFELTRRWEYLRGKNENFIDAIMPRLRHELGEKEDLLGECLDALKTCFDAIQSIPIDSLGVGREVMTAPDGETGELTWPIRDEVLDSIKAILNKAKEEL